MVRADRLMHGKTTDGGPRRRRLFEGLPSPLEVMRYHSLVIAPATVTRRARGLRLVVRPPGGAGDHGGAAPDAGRSTGSSSTPSRSAPSTAATLLGNFLRLAGYDCASPGWNVRLTFGNSVG